LHYRPIFRYRSNNPRYLEKYIKPNLNSIIEKFQHQKKLSPAMQCEITHDLGNGIFCNLKSVPGVKSDIITLGGDVVLSTVEKEPIAYEKLGHKWYLKPGTYNCFHENGSTACLLRLDDNTPALFPVEALYSIPSSFIQRKLLWDDDVSVFIVFETIENLLNAYTNTFGNNFFSGQDACINLKDKLDLAVGEPFTYSSATQRFPALPPEFALAEQELYGSIVYTPTTFVDKLEDVSRDYITGVNAGVSLFYDALACPYLFGDEPLVAWVRRWESLPDVSGRGRVSSPYPLNDVGSVPPADGYEVCKADQIGGPGNYAAAGATLTEDQKTACVLKAKEYAGRASWSAIEVDSDFVCVDETYTLSKFDFNLAILTHTDMNDVNRSCGDWFAPQGSTVNIYTSDLNNMASLQNQPPVEGRAFNIKVPLPVAGEYFQLREEESPPPSFEQTAPSWTLAPDLHCYSHLLFLNYHYGVFAEHGNMGFIAEYTRENHAVTTKLDPDRFYYKMLTRTALWFNVRNYFQGDWSYWPYGYTQIYDCICPETFQYILWTLPNASLDKMTVYGGYVERTSVTLDSPDTEFINCFAYDANCSEETFWPRLYVPYVKTIYPLELGNEDIAMDGSFNPGPLGYFDPNHNTGFTCYEYPAQIIGYRYKNAFYSMMDFRYLGFYHYSTEDLLLGNRVSRADSSTSPEDPEDPEDPGNEVTPGEPIVEYVPDFFDNRILSRDFPKGNLDALKAGNYYGENSDLFIFLMFYAYKIEKEIANDPIGYFYSDVLPDPDDPSSEYKAYSDWFEWRYVRDLYDECFDTSGMRMSSPLLFGKNGKDEDSLYLCGGADSRILDAFSGVTKNRIVQVCLGGDPILPTEPPICKSLAAKVMDASTDVDMRDEFISNKDVFPIEVV
jgi:hypothetical protein